MIAHSSTIHGTLLQANLKTFLTYIYKMKRWFDGWLETLADK